ncbi:GFA family protein [Niveibacterium sp.]|uniref:GFA family protein n=1 Tax=Niveibacterium sp. TaxID=2017444 RepID=UPI0035B18CF6
MHYHGSCHCGRIAYEVEGEVEQGIECNCSHCSRKGYCLWFVSREQVRLLTPPSAMSTYTFNRHVIQHHFCPICGCSPFGFGRSPDGKETAAVNLRCLQDLDLASVPRVQVDGRSF